MAKENDGKNKTNKISQLPSGSFDLGRAVGWLRRGDLGVGEQKKCSCGWNGKRPGAKARLRYRSFVGLKPHANPNDPMPWAGMRLADGALASLLKTKSPAGAGLIAGREAD
jgi:hypothetical protein